MASGNMGDRRKTGLKGPRNKYITSAKPHADEDRITAGLEPKTKIGRCPYGPLNFELGGKYLVFKYSTNDDGGELLRMRNIELAAPIQSGRELVGSLRCYESAPLRAGDNAAYLVIGLT